ncbi:MAG: alpha/beta hydrolase family protein, partial [Phycisphaeraceae bacterium]
VSAASPAGPIDRPMHQQPFEIERAGLTLRGTTYLPRTDRRQPTVVLLHGFTGQRMEAGFLFVRLARALNERGIAAVTFDFLHSGESDGSFEHMLVTGEVEDALRVTEWAQRQPFVDRSRLGLLGFSLGGLIASCVMGRSDAYRALALLAPSSVRNMCRFSGDRESCEDGRPNIGAHLLHPRFFEDLQTLDPFTELARRTVPTLLVHGTGDETVPPDESLRYAGAIETAGGSAQRVTIDGADHGFAKPRWQQPLIEHVCEFMGQTLE